MKNLVANIKHKESRLKNGGRLITISIPNYPVSVASVWFNVGARFDPEGKEGLAHFFEHVMMLTTPSYLDRIQRLQELESRGISFNARTTNELSYYYHVQSNRMLYDSLDFLINGIENSIITRDNVEHDKKIILDEESRNRADPMSFLWRLSYSGIWPNDRLGHGFFGDNKTLNNISYNDIIDFKETHFSLDEAVFVIITRESHSKIAAYIDKQLTTHKATNRQRYNFDEPGRPLPIVKDVRKNDGMVTIGYNFKTCSIKDFEERVKLELLKDIIAGTWISTLIKRLRIQGDDTYWVYGDTEYFSNTGYIGFNLTTRKERLPNVLDTIEREIKSVKTNGISSEMLNAVKMSHISRQNKDILDFTYIVWWYGSQAVLSDSIISLKVYEERIYTMMANDIKKVAQKYFIEENFSLALIGDV